MTESVVPRATVRELVAAFERAERTVRESFRAISEAEHALNGVFAPGETFMAIRVSASGERLHDDFGDANRAIEIMTRAAWRTIVERLELKRFMSVKRWNALQDELYQRSHPRTPLPPITERNVLDFAHRYLEAAPEMLTEAVEEVFDWLRPHRHTVQGKLKTNTEMEIGPKAIVGYMVELGFTGRFRVAYGGHASQRLTALENVFSALAGRGSISKGYQSLIEAAINDSPKGTGETDLFRFRACKNGNLHIEFKRLDLLAKFNQMAGGKRLRPAPAQEAAHA
jgi:hypothetical protein